MNKWLNYIIIFVAVFSVSFGVLYFLNLVPDTVKEKQDETLLDLIQRENPVQVDINNEDGTFTTPDRVYIPSVGVDTKIQKPQSQSVAILDEALKLGAVYYPGSGSIENGNVLLFGHSSNWQVVQNQAFKTFNGIEKLNSGDEIYLDAGEKTFVYKVRKVSLLNENQAEVKLDVSGRVLTISTCNTFGAKQERWVVTAEFEGEM